VSSPHGKCPNASASSSVPNRVGNAEFDPASAKASLNMAVTRSSKKQSHIEDFSTNKDKPSTKRESKSETTQKPKPNANKRKAHESQSTKQSPPKKSKTEPTSKPTKQQQSHLSGSGEDLENPIMINRSPVLHLWGACVAHVQHPDLSWPACLNVGSAISTLCAVSKGKAIGMIEPKDRSADEEAAKKKKKDKAKEGARTVEVMGFELPMQGEAVVLGGSKKEVKEGNLIAKFGSEGTYEEVKRVMQGVLDGWKGKEDELGKSAFGMYERFRPTVPKGQHGWGRKGELSLREIESVAKT
jgi:DNA mismatch repair ATPase MutL